MTISNHAFKRKPINKSTRLKVWNRYKQICYLCGKYVLYKDMHVDHIVPVVLGGTNALSNLAPTHKACNLRKGKNLP